MKALITGITGQAGSYMAELLLSKGYEVHGMARNPLGYLKNIHHIKSEIELHEAHLQDGDAIKRMVAQVRPDEMYHLAAEQIVALSFDTPLLSGDVNGLGAARVLEAFLGQDRRSPWPQTKLMFCSSSEIFGRVDCARQDEETRVNPVNPYACAKVYGHFLARVYRESWNLWISRVIPFSMESPRRPEHFVTRKITRGAARIKLGLAKELKLGNPAAQRDWGYCADSVEAMWLIMQQQKPDDYVIATGEPRSVLDFVKVVFGLLDLKWEDYVTFETKDQLRPVDIPYLCGDSTKIRKLGWEPRVTFEELVKMMLQADLESLEGK
jgi:GDPmannose 4,6-dehydratase